MVERKKWIDVELDVLGTSTQLFAIKPEDLVGMIIKYDLTKYLKGKNCEADFRVVKKDDKVVGEMFRFILFPSYIRRLIGHGISMVEDSFVCPAQDFKLRIKTFLITRKQVHRSVRKALRSECKKTIEKFVSENDSGKVFQAVVSSTLQRTLSKRLKKIYPLAVCEIRVAEIVRK